MKEVGKKRRRTSTKKKDKGKREKSPGHLPKISRAYGEPGGGRFMTFQLLIAIPDSGPLTMVAALPFPVSWGGVELGPIACRPWTMVKG